MMITLHVQGSSSKFSVDAVDPDAHSVLDLKERIIDKLNQETADPKTTVEQIRLIFAGKILKNEHMLSEYGLNKDGLTVHLVKSAPKSTSTNATSSSGNAPATAPRTEAPPIAPPALQAQQGQMPPLTAFAAPGAFPSALPGGAANAQQLRQMIQLMRANPALYEQIMRSTPGFAQFPPAVQQALLDPNSLEQIANMMVDPGTAHIPVSNAEVL